MADSAHVSLPATVELHGLTIYKLNLMETAEAMKHLRDMPRLFAALQVADEDNILEIAMPLIIDFMPSALEILKIATRLDINAIDAKLGGDMGKAVECFLAVFQVNNFLSVGEGITKAMGAMKPLAEKPQPKK